MSVQVKYRHQFLIGLILFVLFFAVIEGLVRSYEWAYPECEFIGKDSHENIDYFLQKQICLDTNSLAYDRTSEYLQLQPNQKKSTITIDDNGFRGISTNLEKTENTYRIVMIGGSTIFGTGTTSDEKTIPGFLEKKINERNNEKIFEVVNAGINHADSFTEKFHVKNKILNFKPDLIIIYDGWNDSRYLEIMKAKIEGNNTKEKESSGTGIIGFFDNLEFYRTPIVIFRTFFYDDSSSDIKSELNEELGYNIASTWKNNIKEICDVAKEKDVSTIIALQPLLGRSDKKMSNDEFEAFSKYTKHDQLYFNMNELSNNLKELSTCNKTVDLVKTFDKTEKPVYWDMGHLNDDGNEIIAEELTDIVLNLIKTKN